MRVAPLVFTALRETLLSRTCYMHSDSHEANFENLVSLYKSLVGSELNPELVP